MSVSRSSKSTANTVIISGTVVGSPVYGFNAEYETNELKFMINCISYDSEGKAYSNKELCKVLGDAATTNQDLSDGMKITLLGRLKYPKGSFRGFVQGYELDRQ